MATPKKRYRYTFLYTDQTYLTYELTRDDYENVLKAVAEWGRQGGTLFAVISIGIISISDIRSIIEQKEEEPQLDEEGNPLQLPVLDQESYNWIKQYMGGDE